MCVCVSVSVFVFLSAFLFVIVFVFVFVFVCLCVCAHVRGSSVRARRCRRVWAKVQAAFFVNASRCPPRRVCFWLALRYCVFVCLEVLCLFEGGLVPKMVGACSRVSGARGEV